MDPVTANALHQRVEDVSATPAPVQGMQRTLLLSLGFIFFAMVALPYAYAVALYQENFARAFAQPAGILLYWNAACNSVVMIWALHVRGRFDRKLASILNRVFLVHGTLAFFVLVARHPHSNQVMLQGAMCSVLLAAIVMIVTHRERRASAALLGDWHPLAKQVRIPCDWIQNPNSDVSKYEVLLTSSVIDLSTEWAQALSRALLMGKPVRHLAEFVEEDQGRVCLEHFDLDHLPAHGLVSYQNRKRLMDIGLVLLSLPVTLPILGLGALLSWMMGGGPVLFVQDRVGRGGRVFKMYKLRTMRTPQSADAVSATTGRDDERITPIGRWLRRFRVDELPQLLNVLKGDMSVIGPRPEWVLLSDKYVRELPVYAYRHLVRPGITGWAQVRGGYAADMAETRIKVGYDLFYIKNLSFSLDVQILGRTILTLITGSGAR